MLSHNGLAGPYTEYHCVHECLGGMEGDVCGVKCALTDRSSTPCIVQGSIARCLPWSTRPSRAYVPKDS